MSTITDIEVIVLYQSIGGKEISFFDLLNHREAIDSEASEPANFWWSYGGFEIAINDYKVIFHSCNFQYLVKATSFLIQSLYWLQGEKSDWFDTDDDYPNDVVLKTTSGEELHLTKNGIDDVKLSFTPKKKPYENERATRYFENLVIGKAEWENATRLALNEYFEVLLSVIQNSPDDEMSKTMLNYYDVWKDISNYP